jgi:hypothetical protein
LAAILDIKGADMVNSSLKEITPTQNPLLYRDRNNEIVFVSHDDLQKFSIKFVTFKNSYLEHQRQQAPKVSASNEASSNLSVSNVVKGAVYGSYTEHLK